MLLFLIDVEFGCDWILNGLLYFAKQNETKWNETKRNEMKKHVLKWTYQVPQQSDSSVP